jgi:hypothetical protein
MSVFNTPSKRQDMIGTYVLLDLFVSRGSCLNVPWCRYRAGVRGHRVHRGTQPLSIANRVTGACNMRSTKKKSRASPARLTWLLQPEYSAYISSASITQLPAQCLFGLDLVVHIHTVPSAHLFRGGRSPFIWSGTIFWGIQHLGLSSFTPVPLIIGNCPLSQRPKKSLMVSLKNRLPGYQ